MAIAKFGVQMMMLKGKIEELGVYETMRHIAELGYYSVEVSQLPMTEENVVQLRRASQDFNIEIAALSAALEPMMANMPGESLATHFDKIVKDCKTLDCNHLRIGMLPFTLMGSKEKTLEFIARAEECATKLAEHNIKLYYHNHHNEFVKFDGVYLLDMIREGTTHLGFELDVHWIQRGGANPVEVIKRFKDRIALLHLKDYRIGMIDLKILEGGLDFVKIQSAFANIVQFAELGEGNLDIKAIIEAGVESGAQYLLVEQDDLYGKDAFDCLQISANHLKKLGYSDWF
ncbi:sugar phosphate isomerase/epimerase family protein [Paenibacillus endoradicis]|uniref:sugar phosphate isomerase/epimerase family protein n=1 Tax=Paenibacillus endoradicis TaxID=2972487 RepID=UPI0021596D85|nr:sugar phosphate isomerase/epimerase [Paenibacillus endoradicis]MCR8657685.1 sugar phosphate isomerase/epimerase [Paenibacillus endoradicis]